VTAVIDANVLIDVLHDERAAVAALDAISAGGDELWSSVTARVEILGLVRPGEEDATLALLGAIWWQDVTTDIADGAAAYVRRYRRSHSGIDLADYILAATADVLGGRLVTRNVRHFPMFPGLEPAY
jgi:predicted nucleic acid-binding protein